MRKENELLKAINDIDDNYINETDLQVIPFKSKKRYIISGICSVACVGIILGVVAVARFTGTQQREIMITPTAVATESTTQPQGNFGVNDSVENDVDIPWKDLAINQKYNSFKYNEMNYISNTNKTMDLDKVGKLLTTMDISTTDNKGKVRIEKADIYGIKGVSENCALAVSFPEYRSGSYFSYACADYVPENLGQLIDDLDLKNNLEVENAVTYNDDDTMNIYTNISVSKIFETILSDITIKPFDSETFFNEYYKSYEMEFEINVPVTGDSGISLAYTSDGYVSTNIMRNSYVFYVGKENCEKLSEYVKGCEVETKVCPTEFISEKTESVKKADSFSLSCPYLNYNGNEYKNSPSLEVDKSKIGSFKENCKISTLNQTEYDGEIYNIENVSDKYAVAVKVHGLGNETYFLFTNENYSPKNLGEFMTDLDLKNTIEVQNAVDTDYSNDIETTYLNISKDKLFEILLSDKSAKSYDFYEFNGDEHNYGIVLEMSSMFYNSYPDIIYTDDGYIIINALKKGYVFFVGKEKCAQWDEYLKSCRSETNEIEYPTYEVCWDDNMCDNMCN